MLVRESRKLGGGLGKEVTEKDMMVHLKVRETMGRMQEMGK